jgi:hypothetical protein
MRKTIFLHASFPILLGVFLILVVIGVEDIEWPHPATYSSYVIHFMKFVDHVGIAFLSLGVIGLLLEFPHWHKYFYNLFVDTITSEAYIEKRRGDKKWLDEMQSKLMKAFFGTKDIEKPGGFYQYYREQLQKFIGEPYRDQYTSDTKIQYSRSDPNAFAVTEVISYQCCRLGENIDKIIGWTARKDELIAMPSFKITLMPQGEFESKVFESKGGQYPPELIPDSEGGWGYTMSLEPYQRYEGLSVTIDLEYVVARDRPFSTKMRSISHGRVWTMTYPTDLTINVDRFVSNHTIRHKNPAPGKCTFEYPEWLLPGDGIAFHFRKP